ncbi:hypothetical protein LTR65_010221 [Meristemomyces frigidus]
MWPGVAVPVKPDTLCERLDAFMKVLPTIHTLRLCHRFGRGLDVHLTKLPVEIEQTIEALLVKSSNPFDNDRWFTLCEWSEQFECFESRCEPRRHLPDSNSPLSDAADDEVAACEECAEQGVYESDCKNVCKAKSKDRCDECKSGASKQSPELCEKSCAAKKIERKNELAMSFEYGQTWGDIHHHACGQWKKRIDQRNGGGFVKYAEVLRKEFGLAELPRNYRYHNKDELRTTLCYLTLPQVAAIDKAYSTSEDENECGYVGLLAAHAMDVRLPGLVDEARIRSRFHRALRILGLRPYVHPSQRNLALPPQKSGATTEEGAAGGTKKKKVVLELCKSLPRSHRVVIPSY